MSTIEDIHEALERVRVHGSRSHTTTALEKTLGKEFAHSSSFATVDLVVAVLEAEGLGADTEERRRIAAVLGWPVSEAMHIRVNEGWNDGFTACKEQVKRRLFG